jgi:hypothetical protein
LTAVALDQWGPLKLAHLLRCRQMKNGFTFASGNLLRTA